MRKTRNRKSPTGYKGITIDPRKKKNKYRAALRFSNKKMVNV